MKVRWTCLSGPSSFGLGPEAKEYVLEEVFHLVRHGKLSIIEAWDFPVEIRRWWLKRVTKALKEEGGQSAEEPMSPFKQNIGRK